MDPSPGQHKARGKLRFLRILVATVSVWGEGPNFSLSLHCNPKGGKIGRCQMHSCLSVNAGIRFNLSFPVAGSCE